MFRNSPAPRVLLAAALMLVLASTPSAMAATAERAVHGTLKDGSPTEAITLRNASGVSATILPYGVTLQALLARDREGRTADIVLGYPPAGPALVALPF